MQRKFIYVLNLRTTYSPLFYVYQSGRNRSFYFSSFCFFFLLISTISAAAESRNFFLSVVYVIFFSKIMFCCRPRYCYFIAVFRSIRVYNSFSRTNPTDWVFPFVLFLWKMSCIINVTLSLVLLIITRVINNMSEHFELVPILKIILFFMYCIVSDATTLSSDLHS